MLRGAEGTQLQVGRRMGGWHSEWVRQRGKPGIRPGSAVKREGPVYGVQGEWAV